VKRVLSLIGRGVGASLSGGTYFRVSFFLKVLSGLVRAATMLVFWRGVLALSPKFLGWDEGSLMVFMAASELFFGLHLAFMSISGRFWAYIRTGMLDVYLTRPCDPRLLVLRLWVRGRLRYESYGG
jgi:ABC-type uncharacterized transport system permease subunit